MGYFISSKDIFGNTKIPNIKGGVLNINKHYFIKVLDPIKIQELESAGFSTYIKEIINGQNVGVFESNSKIIKYIKSHFAESDFFYANTLHF